MNNHFTKHAFSKGKKWGTKRRKMTSFKMGEISAVDVPAQEGARVTLIKSAPVADDDCLAFAKVSFKEALNDKLWDRKFSDAFYAAFDDIWTLNDAFREALKDQYQSDEETVRQYIQAVAEKAQAAVEATRGLSKSSSSVTSTIKKAVFDAANDLELPSKENEMFKTLAELKAAITKFAKDGGDAAEIKKIRKSAVELDAIEELPADGDLAIAPAAAVDNTENETLKRKVAVLEMSTDVRKHYDGLSEDDQTAFLTKSADDQAAIVAKANEEDPVEVTLDDGTQIRKSAGPAVIALAKSNQKLSDDLKKANDANADAAFQKTAREEFEFLPEAGTVEMLKAADKISDKDKKKEMLDALRASNKAASKNFKRNGNTGDLSKNDDDSDDAEDKLNELAKAHAKENNTSFAKAYSDVLETEEGAKLYAETQGVEAE